MKKTGYYIAIPLVMIFLAGFSTYGLEVPDLLEKSIAAQGGRTALKGIHSQQTEGSLVLVAQGGMSGKMVIRSKDPDKTRTDMEIMGMKIIQAFDGETAWADNPMMGGVNRLEGVDALNMKRNAIGSEALLNPAAHGITYTAKGTEKVGDIDCFIVEQHFPDDHVTTLYFDSSTYLIKKAVSKVETSQGSFTNELHYSDYQTTDGITSAREIKIYRDGQEFIRMTIDRISYNPEIGDEIFSMKEES